MSLGMLNKNGIHLNDYGATRLANNFCFSVNAWQDETCMAQETEGKKKNLQ